MSGASVELERGARTRAGIEEGSPTDRICHLLTEQSGQLRAICGKPPNGIRIADVPDDPAKTPCSVCGRSRCSRCALEYSTS